MSMPSNTKLKPLALQEIENFLDREIETQRHRIHQNKVSIKKLAESQKLTKLTLQQLMDLKNHFYKLKKEK